MIVSCTSGRLEYSNSNCVVYVKREHWKNSSFMIGVDSSVSKVHKVYVVHRKRTYWFEPRLNPF